MTKTQTTEVRPATISKQLTKAGFDRSRVKYGTGFHVKSWRTNEVKVSYYQTTGSYLMTEEHRGRINEKVERMRQALIELDYTVEARDGWQFMVTEKRST